MHLIRRVSSLFAICALFGVAFGDRRISEHDSKDSFSEELLISPLKSGHVYLHFKFLVSTPLQLKHSNLDLFPKPVIDILQRHSASEFHVRLTQGLFRHEKWGYPIDSAPTGGEVWAWFHQNSSVADNWRGLTNSLAGLFCATFNDIKPANSMSPKWAFRPEGLSSPEAWSNNSLLRYSILPRENLCTENVTPWKKLLPCYDRSGLAKLLNAIKLLSSNYFSLALHAKPVCGSQDCSEKRLELQLSATSVLQPASVQDYGKFDWSLRDLLEIELDSGCPLTSSSLIHVDQSLQGKMIFYPESHRQTPKSAIFDLRNFTMFPIQLGGKSASKLVHQPIDPPQITIHRFTSGSGQQSGGIHSLIANHGQAPIVISYLEMIPWYLRIYLHTVRVRNGMENIPLIKSSFVPALDRLSPHQIELFFEIPAKSVAEFSVEFDFTLLKWTEYPPDASHGFEIPPAVVSTKFKSCSDVIFGGESGCFIRLYSEALLVNIPVPDFSMPYNVICMTCTVLALAFGPIHALTTKNFKPLDPLKNPNLAIKVKGILMEKAKQLFAKKKPKTE